MITHYETLSNFKYESLSSNIPQLSLKSYNKYFNGGFIANFTTALSGCRDFKRKNFTNFYLTNNYQFEENFKEKKTNLRRSNIFGHLLTKGIYYLTYDNIDSRKDFFIRNPDFLAYERYKNPKFTTDITKSTKINIEIKNDNVCNIYFNLGGFSYYLANNDKNEVFFAEKSELKTDNNQINAEDFEFIYAKNDDSILIFKNILGIYYTLSYNVEDDEITFVPVTPNDFSKQLQNRFKITNNINSNYSILNNHEYVSFLDSVEDINQDRVEKKINNNYLIVETNSSNDKVSDLLVLKNQLPQTDIFSSCNNLLSGNGITFFIDSMRNYTNIFEDIDDEKDEELSLNYLFNNKTYRITPGRNTITTTNSLYPYEKMNINDTLFIHSGSYANLTPYYSDKIYQISDDPTLKTDNQYLLCTWLSGFPNSPDSVWVDRYYYPDLIEKEAALRGKNSFDITYQNNAENFSSKNSTLSSKITKQKFFDKISDLCFIPSTTYIYDRINTTNFTYDTENIVNNLNYYEEINQNSKFTLIFKFYGDSEDWTIFSERNLIDSGLKIQKIGHRLIIDLNIYDYDRFTYDISDIVKSNTTISYGKNVDNFFGISVNANTGKGYIFLNDKVFNTINIPKYELSNKKILYGKFLHNENNVEKDIKNSSKIISPMVTSNYTELEEILIIKNLLYIKEDITGINDITISLPCGTRNSIDNIDVINSISPYEFKSNNINIYIKNLGNVDPSVLEEIQRKVLKTSERFLPINSKIENVKFLNYR